MAYTIKLNMSDVERAIKIRNLLHAAIEISRFVAEIDAAPGSTGRGSREGSRQNGLQFRLSRIRLREPKPYCGQHPGECERNARKMRATYLEWDDWVEFNYLVNDVLDAVNASADVWSKPLDVSGIFWIRKGHARRLRYEWEEELGLYGRIVRVWNRGTEDQFQPEN